MIVVPELVHIWHYQAPRSKNHRPRIIPDDRQEIEIVSEGRGYFEYEGRLLEVTPGMILWHQPGDQTIYLTDLEQPYACIVVTFQDVHGVLMPRVSQWTDRVLFQSFIDEILTEYHSENSDRRKLACYIYGQLCWQSQAHIKSTQNIQKGNVEMKWVVDWIEKHYAEEIRLKTLSDIAGISIPHLHTTFKQFTGKTPYQYIQSRRLQEAKILLASTRLAVKEIAFNSGFPDVGNFCRVFKQCYGVTAQEYRLQHTLTW